MAHIPLIERFLLYRGTYKIHISATNVLYAQAVCINIVHGPLQPSSSSLNNCEHLFGNKSSLK